MFVFIFAHLNLSVPYVIWKCWAPAFNVLQDDWAVS